MPLNRGPPSRRLVSVDDNVIFGRHRRRDSGADKSMLILVAGLARRPFSEQRFPCIWAVAAEVFKNR